MDNETIPFVRIASSDDFQKVTELLQSENLPVEDIPKDLAHFFVIDYGGKIVAAGGLEVYENTGLLRSMIVDKEFRNRSLAAILLNRLLLYASEQEITALYLITTTAEKYFERTGFKIISRGQGSAVHSFFQGIQHPLSVDRYRNEEGFINDHILWKKRKFSLFVLRTVTEVR